MVSLGIRFGLASDTGTFPAAIALGSGSLKCIGDAEFKTHAATGYNLLTPNTSALGTEAQSCALAFTPQRLHIGLGFRGECVFRRLPSTNNSGQLSLPWRLCLKNTGLSQIIRQH